MSKVDQSLVQVKIAEIIDRSRYGDEMFFIDSKTAASDILRLLQKENIIPGGEAVNPAQN